MTRVVRVHGRVRAEDIARAHEALAGADLRPDAITITGDGRGGATVEVVYGRDLDPSTEQAVRAVIMEEIAAPPPPRPPRELVAFRAETTATLAKITAAIERLADGLARVEAKLDGRAPAPTASTPTVKG